MSSWVAQADNDRHRGLAMGLVRRQSRQRADADAGAAGRSRRVQLLWLVGAFLLAGAGIAAFSIAGGAAAFSAQQPVAAPATVSRSEASANGQPASAAEAVAAESGRPF